MKRREFIFGLGSGILLPSASAFGQDNNAFEGVKILGEIPPLPADLRQHANLPPARYLDIELTGRARPTSREKEDGLRVLRQSPFDVQPIDVAQYFLAVGAGAWGGQVRPFAREWPVRANPVIMHFFSATQTGPRGDTTPWCAAFVNWCILRAHSTTRDKIGRSKYLYDRADPFDLEDIKRYSTNSAASGSFRCWDESASPKRGEIAVFANRGTSHMTERCLGRGHVAFYLSNPRSGRIRVLGGNQSQRGSNGAVTIADMPATGRFMKIAKLKR